MQYCGSGSAWVHIHIALLDPDPDPVAQKLTIMFQINLVTAFQKGFSTFVGRIFDLLPNLSIFFM
jgi:hypothetical protein